MGTKAKVGREQSLLFTSVILCKFPEFREESVGRAPPAEGRSPETCPPRPPVPLRSPPPPGGCARSRGSLARDQRGPQAHTARGAGSTSPRSPWDGRWARGPCPRSRGRAPGKGHLPRPPSHRAQEPKSSRQPVTADSRGPWKPCSFRGSGEADGGGRGVLSPAVAPHPVSLRGGGCPGKSGWVQSLKRKYN